jgi:hypothetical protein
MNDYQLNIKHYAQLEIIKYKHIKFSTPSMFSIAPPLGELDLS